MKSAEQVFEVKRFVSDVFRWRQIRRINTKEFAYMVGVAPSSMSCILRRQAEPSLAVICRMADICNLSLDDYRRNHERRTRVA